MVVEETTAARLQRKLKTKYEKKLLMNRLYRKRCLHRLRMTGNMLAKYHLRNFNRIVLYLKRVRFIIGDEVQSIILLCSMSDSHENFVDTMLYSGDNLSVSDVKDVMQLKNLKRKLLVSNEDGSELDSTVSRGEKRKETVLARECHISNQNMLEVKVSLVKKKDTS